MEKKLGRFTAVMLTLVFFTVQFLLPGAGIRTKAASLSGVGVTRPMNGWSVPVNAEGNTYNLHVWVADERMGEWRENAVYHKGIMHYICYELTNKDTGALADDIDFEAQATIWDPEGNVGHDVTYSSEYGYHDDYGTDVSAARNYIGCVGDSTGKWKGTVAVTGDITVDVTVYWNITVPYVNLHVWVSDEAMGSPHGGSSDPFALNDWAYLCYELTDLDNGCQLDGHVTGFAANEVIYDPDGNTVYEYSYDSSMSFKEGYSMAYNWIGAGCEKAGLWHGVVTLTGDIDLELEVWWTVTEDGIAPTEPPYTPPEDDPTADHFVWGQDNWNFDNHDGYFIYGYYVNNKMLNKLAADCALTNVDKELLRKNMEQDSMGTFGGSCYGITMSEILAKDGRLDLSRYGGQRVVNRNENTEDMLSLANFMYELQNVPCMNQVTRQSAMQEVTQNHTQDEFMRKLEAGVQTGDGLINLCFGIAYDDGSGMYGFHSILAYGTESGFWTKTYKNRTRTYDRRILIADPNYLTQNMLYEDACIYYSSEDYSWVLPAYNTDGICCYWDASFGSNEPCGYLRNIIRHTGMKQYTDLMLDTPDALYLPGLSIQHSSQTSPKVYRIEGSGNPNLDSDGKIEPYYITGADSDSNSYYWALDNPTASYEVVDSQYTSFDCLMDYEDVAFSADVTNTSNMYFNPKGQIELIGSGTNYSISIITNKERCVTDWYSVQVAGEKTNNLLYAVIPDGYVLKADNLQGINVYAFNDKDYAYLNFSTKYKTVLIHEISPQIIGISVDQDNDGKYETLIAQGEGHVTEEIELGDLNEDGSVNASDAAQVLIAAANLGAGNSSGLTGAQESAADINHDSHINATDAALILIYAAAVGGGNTDFVLGDVPQ